jgi:hypothetical protein
VRPSPGPKLKITERGNPGFSKSIDKKEISKMSEVINWHTNWQEARDEAKKSNLPLALEFFLEG